MVNLPLPKPPIPVAAALGELRHGLRDALLLELQPGEAFMQESSVVLLAGKLLMSGKADSVPLQQHAGQPLLTLTPLCCCLCSNLQFCSRMLVGFLLAARGFPVGCKRVSYWTQTAQLH